MNDNLLGSFFNPSGVAIIGASQDENKLGYGVARNLIASGYNGNIGLVNPKGGELFGHPIYSSLDEIKFSVDLCIVVVPARYVPETLVACSHNNVEAVIIISGGFREVGEDGRALEDECERIALEKGLRIIGPNCIGVVDTHTPIDTTFIQPPMPEVGKIAFISQSGALGAAIIDWARGEGFGFSQIVSLGNQLDVSETDILASVAEAPSTSVITMYLESVQDGSKFLSKAAGVTPKKPVIVQKVGRSEVGKQAASSHTGALAGSNIAYDAAFRRSGLLPAETTEEMFEWAKILAWAPSLPAKKHIAILTNAGGPGVIAADAAAREGLEMADFSEETLVSLQEILPPVASIKNPVDMLASASPADYAQCLEILIQDPGVDMVLVIAPPLPMFEALDVAKALVEVISRSKKPVAVSFMGSTLIQEAMDYLSTHKIPDYRFPERAVRALAALHKYAAIQSRDLVVSHFHASEDMQQMVSSILSSDEKSSGFIPAKDAEKILSCYQIPTLSLQLAATEEEAVRVADASGYPVVMKIASEKISHKTDVGGVLLNLQSAEDVRQAFHRLNALVQENGVRSEIDGVFIQKMISSGQEVIVGAVRDPVVGPLLMFGSGGVEVEGLKDVQFATIPPANFEIEFLLERTWAGKKLRGFRNYQPADMDALKDIFIKLSQLMIDFPEINEVEVNPVIVLEEGNGAFAVDARILL